MGFAVPASARGWRGLEPLQSTRADVVRLLGQPSVEWEGFMRYELDSETVTVALTTERIPRSECTLDVEPGTVERISIEPQDSRTLGDFGLRESRMRRVDLTPKGQKNGPTAFVDSRAGVAVRTYEGEVHKVVFVAPAAIRRRCQSYASEYRDLEGLVSPEVIYEAPVPVCVGVSAAGDVYVGDSVAVMASAATPDDAPLTYTWITTCGRIVGSGSNVTFDATGLGEGPCTVTAQIDDGFGHTVECSTTVNVRARPPSIP